MENLGVFCDCLASVWTPALGQLLRPDFDELFDVHVSDDLVDLNRHVLRRKQTEAQFDFYRDPGEGNRPEVRSGLGKIPPSRPDTTSSLVKRSAGGGSAGRTACSLR